MNHVARKSVFRMFPVLLCAASLPAWAGDDAKFKDMDTNSDGMISSTEHAASVTRMFGEMDANGDGKVSAAEMDSRHAMKHDKGSEPRTMNDASDAAGMQHKSDSFATMDTDGDGMLSSAEHDAGAASMFSAMDTDGNGSLSKQEMAAGHATRKSKP